MRIRIIFLLCVSLVSVDRTSLHAQTTSTASITGIITDPKGAVVPSAKVTARNAGTGLVQTRPTNNLGVYALVALPPGRYEVTCEAAQFARAVVPSIRLSVGQNARLDFSLPLETSKYSITVSDTTPVLGSQTTNSQVLHELELNALPLVTRNFVQLTLLTPKVVPASSTNGRGYMGDRYKENQFSFEGVQHAYNYETMDAANSTTFLTNSPKSFYSPESVQEFRVSNSLWTAEQGHAMGGIINVITRSGTNDWHGGAYEYFGNNALNQPDILQVPGFYAFRKNQFGASIGGPIRKEKVYLFSNYEGQRQANTPQLPTVFVQNLPAINAALARLGFPPDTDHATQTADYDQFLFRTDVIASPRHRLMVRYNFFNATNLNHLIGDHGQLDDPITPMGARDQNLRDQGLATNLFSFPWSNWVNDGGVGFEKNDYSLVPKPGVPRTTLAVVGAFQTGANNSEIATGERRFHIHDVVSWTHGAHVTKFGGEYIRSDASQKSAPVSTAVFSGLAALFATPPQIVQLNIFNGGLSGGNIFHANQTGAFVQDQWKLTRKLSLTLGLRYDLEQLSGLQALTDSGRGNLQPRLSFTWSPNEKPLVIRGGFGVYTADRYHPMMAIDALAHGLSFPAFNQAFLAANPFASQYRSLPDVNGSQTFIGPSALGALQQFVSTGTVPASSPGLGFIQVQSPSLPNPYARQWGLEVEYQLGRDFTIAVGYSGLQGVHLPVTINRNLRPATAVLPSGLPDYQVVGPGVAAHLYDPRFGNVYIDEPVGSSLYNAGTLTIRKRFGDNCSFMANYTFSKNLDDAGSLVTSNAPEDPHHIGRDWSVSNDYAKHRLVLWFDANAPSHKPVLGGFGSSVILTAQSPSYFKVTAGTDVNHDLNVFTDRPGLLGRNTFRGDGFFTIDLRIRRHFALRDNWALDLTADFFNPLNRVNVTNFNTVYGQPTLALPAVASFGTPTLVGNAFQTQLGVRVTF